MTHDALPTVPWQITGNHWLSIPCVHPADAAIHAVGVLHRGARSAVEFAGYPEFLEGAGPALARPTLEMAGRPVALGVEGIVWERALHWLPTFTSTPGNLIVRGTIFAPFGRDADIAGAVYAISVENKGPVEVEIALALEGTLGHRQLRVRTPRAAPGAHRVTKVGDVIVLDGTELPGHVALAIAADGEAHVSEVSGGGAPSYAVRRELRIPAN
ncbi:MAG TPA: hypothetical protein VHE78_11665, partial [Gemmatimonadaceae bacterium]|nr:hypothetical protein [Gemmatimonadaceae bacterium]